jgi:hypothetical protein
LEIENGGTGRAYGKRHSFRKDHKMNRWFAVIIVGLFSSAGCDVPNHFPDQISDQQDKSQLCKLLIASHRPILESMFEVELYAVSDETDEWHGALKTLEVATSDPSGHPRVPSSVFQLTIEKLVKVQNAADRMRLEYLLLGSRMSLEERRQFDNYCVTSAP